MILEVNCLNLSLSNENSQKNLLKDVSFCIEKGEIVGLVGESGSGKSLTAKALFGLFPPESTWKGEIIFKKKNLLIDDSSFLHPRGKSINFIPQDPALSLNPLLTIGKQLIEGICYHKKMSRREGLAQALQWLHKVGIGDPHIRLKQYPHEISGGMKQRILIAMALIGKPDLVIADEPTTALDVTIQIQILNLLIELQKSEQTSMLLISHDLGVIAKCCSRILVMLKGEIIETGTAEQILTNPRHSYTQSLLKARQSLENYNQEPL